MALLRNDGKRYGVVAQVLHWAIALFIFVMFGLGYYMEDLPRGPQKLGLYQIHMSLGLTVLALVVLRLVWRRVDPAPALPRTMPRWERTAARVSHALLYLLILVQPVIGYVQSSAAGLPLAVWGVLPLPAVIARDESLAETLIAVHAIVANVLAVLVIIHAAAALRHHFWLKDDVLRRMLPGAAVRG